MDEPLYQPLLAFRLDAEQLASFHPAGPAGILEGQPPAAVLDVGHLVARALCPTPTDLLTCRGNPKKRRELVWGGGSGTTTSLHGSGVEPTTPPHTKRLCDLIIRSSPENQYILLISFHCQCYYFTVKTFRLLGSCSYVDVIL